MAKPRITLIASCSSSASFGTAAPLRCPTRVRTLCPAVFEQDHGRGEAVQEVLPTHWAQFSGAEHAGDGRTGDDPGDNFGVMVRAPEETGAPAVAREQQRPVRRPPVEELAQ